MAEILFFNPNDMTLSKKNNSGRGGQKIDCESQDFQEVVLGVKRALTDKKYDGPPKEIDIWVDDLRAMLCLQSPKWKGNEMLGETDRSENSSTPPSTKKGNLDFNFNNRSFDYLERRLAGALNGMSLDTFLDILRTAPLPKGVEDVHREPQFFIDAIKAWIKQVVVDVKSLSTRTESATSLPRTRGSISNLLPDDYEDILSVLFSSDTQGIRNAISTHGLIPTARLSDEEVIGAVKSVIDEMEIPSVELNRHIRELQEKVHGATQ